MRLKNFTDSSFFIHKINHTYCSLVFYARNIFINSLIYRSMSSFESMLGYIYRDSFLCRALQGGKSLKENNFLSSSKIYIRFCGLTSGILKIINQEINKSLCFRLKEEIKRLACLTSVKSFGAFLVIAILTNTFFSVIILGDKLTLFGFLVRLAFFLYGCACLTCNLDLKGIKMNSFFIRRIFFGFHQVENQT